MPILYTPFNYQTPQAQPRQGMQQPDFYMQQQQQGPSTADFVNAQLQRIKQRAAPPALTPGSRAVSINRQIADPSNFQSYYKRLATIREIQNEQVGRAQAEAALSQLRSQQQIGQAGSAVVGGKKGTSGNTGGRVGSAALPSNPRENFKYAQGIAGNFGWGSPSELAAWYTLGMKESGWRNTAQNPTSTAYGIGQFLNSTWKGVGMAKTSDPALQVEAMARYIKNRYGSPSRALAFHISHNWY
jgi:hypothetical protein